MPGRVGDLLVGRADRRVRDALAERFGLRPVAAHPSTRARGAKLRAHESVGLTAHYPIGRELGALLDNIITDGRWDTTDLGMQVVVEGLALAAFGFMHMTTGEPLLKQLLRSMMSDEARHVPFGVLSLQEFYDGLSATEIRERQEFCYAACTGMRNRYFQSEIWDRMGVDTEAVRTLLRDNPSKAQLAFQGMLFSKIVPNCKKRGLLDAGDGWLRQKFTELGVIQYEDWTDTSLEYTELDEVARDRLARDDEKAGSASA